MKKHLTLTLLLFFVVLIGKSQSFEQMDKIFPGSPEASAMAEYAKIPVDLYTGLAEINLPLLELKGKDLNIPVNLSYHSAGNKVGEVSSSVGLGWVLQSGGVITRIVRSEPDEDDEGYLGPNSRGVFVNQTNNSFHPDILPYANGFHDSQPDVFFFNFLGNSGRFVLDSNGNPVMTPEKDFIIRPAIGPSSTSNYWTIIDKQGNKYKFGESLAEQEETESTRTFGISVTKLKYTSSWYLSSIETPTGEDFTFEYKQGQNIVFEDDHDIYTQTNCGTGYGTTTSKLETFAPKTLERVSSRYGRVEVISSSDRQDVLNGNRIRELVLYNHNNLEIKRIAFTQSYFTSEENCNGADCKRLQLISVDEKYKFTKSIRKYKFDYNPTKLPMRNSPQIDHWGYFNDNNQTQFIPSSNPDDMNIHRASKESSTKAHILEKITYSTGGYVRFNHELNQYTWLTNSLGQTINRGSGGLRISSIEENSNDASPAIITNYSYTYEGTSNESSGTEFAKPTYKNDYLDRNVTIVNNQVFPSNCAGFRIHPFSLNTIYDVDGANIAYGEVITQYADGSREINRFTDHISNQDVWNSDDYYYFRSLSTSASSTPSVIFEEYLSPHGTPFGPASTQNFYQRGKLLEKVVKNSSGQPTYKLVNFYEVDDTNLKQARGFVFEKIDQYNHYIEQPGPNGFDPPWLQSISVYYNASRYTETNRNYRVYQSKETTFDGSNELTKIIDYTYSSSKPTLVKTQTTTFSNGDEGKISYSYPFDLLGLTNFEFTARNQISDYISKYDYINNVQIGSETRAFGLGGNYTNNGGTPLPQKTNFSKKNMTTYSNLTVERYDTYGNVLQYRGNDNVPISVIWGYGNRYPVAKIVNATYDQVTNASIGLNTSILNGTNPNSNSLLAEIDKIRTHSSMWEARVTGYAYIPLIGVTDMTDSRGYRTSYIYDDFRRLQFVKDQDGHLVTENIYEYVTQYNGNGSSATQLIVSVTYGASSDSYQDFVATATGGSGVYDYKWYRGIGTSSTNFESTPSGLSSTYRMSVSCSTHRWVKLVTTSNGATSTRIIRSNNSPCSSGGGGGGGGNPIRPGDEENEY